MIKICVITCNKTWTSYFGKNTQPSGPLAMFFINIPRHHVRAAIKLVFIFERRGFSGLMIALYLDTKVLTFLNRYICTYGSVSAGREKWPFNVIFFKSRASVWPNLMRKPRFLNSQLFLICCGCRKHFGWTCGPILKYHTFDRFYPKSAVFGIFWGWITGFL